MGHLTSKDAYLNLEDRLNWFTQGAGMAELTRSCSRRGSFFRFLQRCPINGG